MGDGRMHCLHQIREGSSKGSMIVTSLYVVSSNEIWMDLHICVGGDDQVQIIEYCSSKWYSLINILFYFCEFECDFTPNQWI
jgi:hypothetical protein